LLIAHDLHQQRIQATRYLPDGAYSCPACSDAVVLKRGRVKVPHFAHQPGADCSASEPESVAHLRAKLFLAKEFRARGYRVEIEHICFGRRVDVAVWFLGKRGRAVAVAVEVQDSTIAVGLMKYRQAIDRQNGFLPTLWVFTSSRSHALLMAAARTDDHEARVPDDMRYVANRDKYGVPVVDGERGWLARAELDAVVRPEESRSWYERGEEVGFTTPARRLKSTKSVTVRSCTSELQGIWVPHRGGRHASVTFRPEAACPLSARPPLMAAIRADRLAS
jgi:hypothetical protein